MRGTVGALLDMISISESFHGVTEDTPVEFSLAPFPNQPFRRFFCVLAGDHQVNGTGSLTIFLDLDEDNGDTTP